MIKYWKINFKGIRLRLRTLTNNYFHSLSNLRNKCKKTMDCHAQFLELWRFLLPFKVNILGYLNFNSKNIRLGVKSLKYNHFLINSIQAVTQKTQLSSLPGPYFQILMVSTNFYCIICWNITVLLAKTFERESNHWKKVFSTKYVHTLLSENQKSKFSYYILGKGVWFY